MKPYSALLVTSHCTLRCKDSLARLRVGSVSAERVEEGEAGVVVKLGCIKGPWLASGGPILAPGCKNRLRKHYFHLSGDLFYGNAATLKIIWVFHFHRSRIIDNKNFNSATVI